MTQRRTESKRVRLMAGLLLLLVFMAGSLAGAATGYGGRDAEGAQGISVYSGHDLGALDLSPGQQAALDEVLARHQPSADSIVQAAMGDLRRLMESVDAEVRDLLSPDQIETLDSMRSDGPRIRAVRRTVAPDGTVIEADTIHADTVR